MVSTRGLVAALAFSAASCRAATINLGDEYSRAPQPRADPSLTGYLGAFFLGSDPYVYFYLSNGNNPVSFKALNKGAPIMKPTKGTGGVRDPALVRGGGAEEGRKWYIVGTDLDIGKTNWGASQRTGSRGMRRNPASPDQ